MTHFNGALSRLSISILFILLFYSTGYPEGESSNSTRIKTPIPILFEDWKERTLGRNGTNQELLVRAEQWRAEIIKKPDPFTPLADITCIERMAKKEIIVWEDRLTMVLVDAFDGGPKLLVVPKHPTNFPIDISSDRLAHFSEVAAASCDALVIAGGAGVTSTSCNIHINPPPNLMLRQMHIHVRSLVGNNSTRDPDFLKRIAAEIRNLLDGTGCI